MQQDKESIKRMAELLRQGATLTDLSCPNCNSPLFRLRDGMLWCGKDEKKVVIVKEGEQPPQTHQPQTQAAPKASNTAYDKLEATLMKKIEDIQAKIEKTEDIDELQKLTVALSELLNSVEKIKRMKA
ncbi:MAG TPA: Sjogren's syndrome/scleroderma autoantigen 1 family protein [Candidatus Acidoferrales bacterium]|nr:Sjogren's syndrome/scleroderma autoantigen 1 family protein [Candidatus Acidoferrales bacterium]